MGKSDSPCHRYARHPSLRLRRKEGHKKYVIASVAWQSPTYRDALHIGDCHVVPPRNDAWGGRLIIPSFRRRRAESPALRKPSTNFLN